MFFWDGFLDVARKLSEPGSEAQYRSAISRAYYFAFHLATPAAKRLGFDDRRGIPEPHKRIWRVFRSATAPGVSDVADLGKELRSMRMQADYEADKQFSQDQARRAVSAAEELSRCLRGI